MKNDYDSRGARVGRERRSLHAGFWVHVGSPLDPDQRGTEGLVESAGWRQCG